MGDYSQQDLDLEHKAHYAHCKQTQITMNIQHWMIRHKSSNTMPYNVHMTHKFKLKIGQYMIKHNIRQWTYIRQSFQIQGTQNK